jgi:acetyl-CoA carboxylase carboxyl transferase subunit alpha
VLMLENSVYSVISAEGCAAILWKDAAHRDKAARAMRVTAGDLIELKVIDDIIPEPSGGAHSDWEDTGAHLKEALLKHLGELKALDVDTLRKARLDKYLAMGQWRSGR